MRLQVPILKTFEFGLPQLYAGLMLLGLAAASGTRAYLVPMIRVTEVKVWIGPLKPQQIRRAPEIGPSPLLSRVLGPFFVSGKRMWRPGAGWAADQGFGFFTRLPLLIFGLWLGGALWWVSRRLYNNAGGYVALGLYFSSPFVVKASSTINADILAAWGLFGIVYTAIGVAHTLYAPPRKWRPRIVLLGVALGLTAGAHLAAAVIGLLLAALTLGRLAFVYDPPWRRRTTSASDTAAA